MALQDTDRAPQELHPDPLSGEPGAHPVAAGVGAAVGGTVAGAALGAAGVNTAAGAALGAAAGPVGAVVGAVAGGILGGLAGKRVAESTHPLMAQEDTYWPAEDAYWEKHFRSCPYFRPGESYDDYRPAFRCGWDARVRYPGRPFEDFENELAGDWEVVRGSSPLSWHRARLAARDAWERAERLP